MSGAMSRRKGANGERRACKLLTRITGEDWIRTPGGDVQFAGDIIPKGVVAPPWDRVFVEVKSYKGCRVEHLMMPTERELGWWRKARDEANTAKRWPCLVVWVAGRGGALVLESPRFAKASRVGWAERPQWEAQAQWLGCPVRVVGVEG